MPRYERLKVAARQQIMRNAIRLFRGFDKKFANFAYVVSLSVIGLRSHQFRRVKHGRSFPGHKKARMPESLGRGHVTAENGSALAANEALHLCSTGIPLACAGGRP